MNSCYNDKFYPEKWGGLGRPSCPASDGPEGDTTFVYLAFFANKKKITVVSSLAGQLCTY